MALIDFKTKYKISPFISDTFKKILTYVQSLVKYAPKSMTIEGKTYYVRNIFNDFFSTISKYVNTKKRFISLVLYYDKTPMPRVLNQAFNPVILSIARPLKDFETLIFQNKKSLISDLIAASDQAQKEQLDMASDIGILPLVVGAIALIGSSAVAISHLLTRTTYKEISINERVTNYNLDTMANAEAMYKKNQSADTVAAYINSRQQGIPTSYINPQSIAKHDSLFTSVGGFFQKIPGAIGNMGIGLAAAGILLALVMIKRK